MLSRHIDLEIESMKKYFGVKALCSKVPRQLLRYMQQFLEEYLKLMCSQSGEEMEHFMLLGRDYFFLLGCICARLNPVENRDL